MIKPKQDPTMLKRENVSKEIKPKRHDSAMIQDHTTIQVRRELEDSQTTQAVKIERDPTETQPKQNLAHTQPQHEQDPTDILPQ